MKILFNLSFLIFSILSFSCKQDNQNISRVNVMEEALVYAKSLYGDNVNLLLKGDVNANGKPDALAAVIKSQLGEMTFWIEKGGVIEKDSESWKVILNMKEKLYSSKGPMINQVEVKFGYIFNFDITQSPIKFNITIANSNGQPASDEVFIAWNEGDEVYKVVPGYQDSDEKTIP
ncbi:MAG: hypothetical protein ACRDFC_04070 [Ignavibacteria bacterium]